MSENLQTHNPYYLWSKEKRISIAKINGEVQLLINEKPYLEKDKDGKEIKLDEETLRKIAQEKSREYYSNALKNFHFSNLVIFSGAGSSVGIGKSNANNKFKGGQTMATFWKELEENNSILDFTEFIKKSGYESKDSNGDLIWDLEKLLDQAHRNKVKDFSLENDIKTIKQFLIQKCTLDISDSKTHLSFLNKITKRKMKDNRVKIFTINYDTLWEQAGNEDGFTIIDGFGYTNPRTFNGRMFDYDIVIREGSRIKEEDSFVPKLFHLYKVHGSLDWYKNDEGEIVQKELDLNDNTKNLSEIVTQNRLTVFPSDNKYEQSYEQPYFEMMSRFQRALRTENTLLVTIGFSFLDRHISSVIEESLKYNTSLSLIVIDPYINKTKDNWKSAFAFAEVDNRTLLVAEKFVDFVNNYPDNNVFEQEDVDMKFSKMFKKLINQSKSEK
jgi:SIR2-like domain